jgi:hypothetical protein
MGTISFQVAETGQTTLTKVYTLPDSQIDRMVTAYQNLANAAVGGTATRAQVLQTWVTGLVTETVGYVANYEQAVALAAVPQASPITPA